MTEYCETCKNEFVACVCMDEDKLMPRMFDSNLLEKHKGVFERFDKLIDDIKLKKDI